MPGKVNPVISESLIQVCAQVIGYDSAITLGGLSGILELNVMMPLIAYDLLESIRLLANAADNFSKRCEEMIEKSLALATILTSKIGYDESARIAKKAYDQRKTIRQVVEEEGIFPKKELTRLFDPRSMIAPMKLTRKKI
jgi:fumarate hydratase class II